MPPLLFHRVLLASMTPLSLAGAQTADVAWAGTLRSTTDTHDLRVTVRPTGTTQSVQIAPASAGRRSERWDAHDLQFTGLTLRFRVDGPRPMSCALDAVPARGYKGPCVLTRGDTAELTIVPPLDGLLLPEHEVRLALDAAPPHVAREATVFVFGPVGYTAVKHGTNGFTCFIERPTARDLWPICHNREGAERIMPVESYRARLRLAGVRDSVITDSVLRGYDQGRFQAPPSAALGYMLSRFAWTANAQTGAPTFLGPHVHFYAPAVTNAQIGVVAGQRPTVPMRVEREGRPDASVIVGVRLIEPPAPSPRE
jgi:hypothetical protein